MTTNILSHLRPPSFSSFFDLPAIVCRVVRRRAFACIDGLDDTMLHDIGLVRDESGGVARVPA